MEVELSEIMDALRQYPPFIEMTDDALLQAMVHDIEIQYVRSGTDVLSQSEINQHLYFIRSGAVEVLSKEGTLLIRMEEGELFGYASLLRQGKVTQAIRTIEDSLFYLIPSVWFKRMYDEDDTFSDFFEIIRETRLHTALESQSAQSSDVSLMTCPIKSLLRRQPISIEQDATVQMAAKKMAEFKVSSLLINHQDQLVGILTDRDLRTRCIALGLPYDTAVKRIMTDNPVTVDSGDFAAEAVMKMMEQNVHHLPVLKDGKSIGVISTGDLVQRESHGSVYLISDIFKQQDLNGLIRISHKLQRTFSQLVHADANSVMIGNAMSRIATTFVERLLQLGEATLGPPPIPYCFIALGSQAREEQTISTDQDNAIILSDEFDPDIHDAYFTSLSDFVCQGLD